MEDNKEPKDKHPGGRPLKFKDPKKLEAAIKKYFKDCDPHWEYKNDWVFKRGSDGRLIKDENGQNQHVYMKVRRLTKQKPYTMSGLARSIGLSRQALINYRSRDEFMDSIRAAKQRCEEYWEGRLDSPFANGARFNLTNNYNDEYQPWSEKREVKHSGQIDWNKLAEEGDGSADDTDTAEDPS